MTKLTCKLWPEEIEYIKECITKRMSWAAIAAWLMDIFWLKMTPQWVNYQMRKLSAGKAINEYSVGNDTELWNIKRMRHKTTLADWSKVSALIENPQVEHQIKELHEAIVDEVKKYAPKYPVVKRTQSKDSHMLLIDPADIHVGKLSSAFETWVDYNSQIAVQRVKEWVQWLLDKSAWYRIEKIMLVVWNDILHIDSPARKTTSGTPQDTDGMRYDNYRMALKLYVDIIEKLITIADVEVVFNPSNHDYATGFTLIQTLEAWFHNNKNIKFNNDMSHRKYTQYGKNMIGTTHGDWAKQNDLPLLMATSEPVMRAATKHRYLFSHHIHHKVMKDYIGVTFESMRSPSPADSWHSRNWYEWAPMGIDAFIFHPEFWQVSRISHLF